MLKLKVSLFLFALATVVATEISVAKDFQSANTEKIVHEALLTQSSMNVKSVKAATESFNTTRSFGLPNNTIPLHYDIFLSTEIHSGNFDFEGVVRINISVVEASNTITIHSRAHNIQEIVIFNSDGSEFDSNVNHTFDEEVEFLIITSQNQFTVGQQLLLQVTYSGVLSESESDHGWFRSFFTDPATNQTVWFATTHFHPIVNTRHAFPCFDEARFRTSIKLQIRHHESYHSIASMSVESTIPDGDYMTTIFETSPPIQIFVLSFTVSNLAFVNTTDDGLEFRVFARPEAIANGQADNALELGVTMLRAIESHFNVNYTIPKSDQIAHPRFEFSSSGDYGILSFAERILLRTDNNLLVLQLNRERVLAHVYSVSQIILLILR